MSDNGYTANWPEERDRCRKFIKGLAEGKVKAVADIFNECTANWQEETSLHEQFADLAHRQWSGWMKYLFEKSTKNEDGTVTIPKWAVDRWTKQIATDYKDLN